MRQDLMAQIRLLNKLIETKCQEGVNCRDKGESSEDIVTDQH